MCKFSFGIAECIGYAKSTESDNDALSKAKLEANKLFIKVNNFDEINLSQYTIYPFQEKSFDLTHGNNKEYGHVIISRYTLI